MKGSSLNLNQNGPTSRIISQQNMNNNKVTIDEKTGKPLKSLESLAPFNEQEEWAKISQIMESFGSGIVRESVFVNDMESEFKERLGLIDEAEDSEEILDKPKVVRKDNEIQKWLEKIGLKHVEEHLMENGYDDTHFLNNIIVSESDLEVCGIPEKDRHKLLEEITKLPKPSSLAELNRNNKTSQTHTIDTLAKWLSSIHLEEYVNVFE